MNKYIALFINILMCKYIYIYIALSKYIIMY